MGDVVEQVLNSDDKQWLSSYELQGRQLDQTTANYNPLGMSSDKGCANCRWFVEPSACIMVQGPISPTGISDYWMAEQPDDAAESPAEDAAEPGEEDTMMGMSELHADEKAVWSTAYKNNLPDSAFLYIESGGSKDADGKTTPRSLRHFPVKDASGKVDQAHVTDALGRIPQSNVSASAKSAALTRVRAMAKNMGVQVSAENKSLSDNVKDMFKGFVQAVRNDGADAAVSFSVKEVGDRTRFMCTFTNNMKDREQTIFSTAAHKDYEQWVDRTKQYPELWVWHTPGTRLGVADWVAETNGIQYASGLIDEGMETRAYELAGSKDLAMSHGYVYADVRAGVYEKYRSYEISALPRKFVSNVGTAFSLLGGSMAFSEQKREFLMSSAGYSAEEVTRLESDSDKFVEFAKTLGVQMKDAEESDAAGMASITRDIGDIKQVLVGVAEAIKSVGASAETAVEASTKALEAATKSQDDLIADHMASKLSKLPVGQKATESDGNVVEGAKQDQENFDWFDKAFGAISEIGGIR
jgi:hypothetical protein